MSVPASDEPAPPTWFEPLLLAAPLRSVPGITAYLEGAPRAKWLPPIVLAVLWGLLGVVWILDRTFGAASGAGTGFGRFQWVRVGILLAIPVVGLVFIARGFDPIELLDVVFAPLLLGLWLFLEWRDDGGTSQHPNPD